MSKEFPYEQIDTKPFTFEEILWGLGMVTSRSFRTDLVVENELSMTPVADLPNHSEEARLMHVISLNHRSTFLYISKSRNATSFS